MLLSFFLLVCPSHTHTQFFFLLMADTDTALQRALKGGRGEGGPLTERDRERKAQKGGEMRLIKDS